MTVAGVWALSVLCVWLAHAAGSAIEFPDDDVGLTVCTTREGHTGACTAAKECDRFSSGLELLRARPRICRFDGVHPVICCRGSDVAEESVVQCGRRNSSAERPAVRRRRDAGAGRTVRERRFVAQGVDARPADWPWMAALGRRRAGQLVWFCGGALVSPRHVLTAAHCLLAVSPHQLLVRLGAAGLQERRVEAALSHPRHSGLQHDIALLTLGRPATGLPSLCLPRPGARHEGLQVLVAGWGLLEFRGELPADKLQQARLRVSDPLLCEAAYRRTGVLFQRRFPDGFQDSKLCAEDVRRGGGADACTGDSGGPLVHEDLDSGWTVLVGIVSSGVGCGSPDYPGIYTRVSAYVQWIHSAMSTDSHS